MCSTNDVFPSCRYGVVRLAKHTPTGVWVAVKCLHKREIIRLKQVPTHKLFLSVVLEVIKVSFFHKCW